MTSAKEQKALPTQTFSQCPTCPQLSDMPPVYIHDLVEHRTYPLTVPDWLAMNPEYIAHNFCQELLNIDFTKLITELGELNKPDDGTELRHGDLFVAANDYRGDNTIIWDKTHDVFVILYQFQPPEDQNIDYDPPHPSFPLIDNLNVQSSGYIGHYGHAYLNLAVADTTPTDTVSWNHIDLADGYTLHLYSTKAVHLVKLWEYTEEPDIVRPGDEGFFYITCTGDRITSGP